MLAAQTGCSTTTNAFDLQCLNRIVHEGPKGACPFTPDVRNARVEVWSNERGQAEGLNARNTLFSNALRGPGVQGFTGSVPPPPDTGHVLPAQILSGQLTEGSLAHIFYSELAQAQLSVSRPYPLSEDLEDDDVDVDLTPGLAPPDVPGEAT